jgi:hypothetical protein
MSIFRIHSATALATVQRKRGKSNFSGTSTIDVDIADSLSYRTSHGTEEKRKKRGKTRKLSKESEGECEAEVVL